MKEGPWEYWFESGKPLMKGNFHQDKEDGLWVSWYDNGNVKDEGLYEQGRMKGVWKGYHPNGVRSYVGSWAIGSAVNDFDKATAQAYKIETERIRTEPESEIKTGKWEFWSEKGIPLRLETYGKNGMLDGKFIRYNSSGGIESDGLYDDGKPSGKWTYYHPHGVVMRECSYKEGKVDGRSKTYSVSNILMEDAEYKDGKLDGDYKLFDERTGKLVSHQVFESGRVSKVLVGDPVKRKK
jgi:antitoxin component YwqK of YwqJK toxin-antitoxin module